MLNANGNGSRGSFHVQFGKWVVDITSSNLFTILTVLGLFGLIAGGAYFQIALMENAKIEHASIREEHTRMRQQIDDKMQAVLYILSRPEHERPELLIPYIIEKRLGVPLHKEQ